ncbi:MAG: DUF808 domain-containing protein [Pseudomonadota bacterium]
MSGLLALLDDVAAIAKVAAASIDDVITQGVKASTKAAGAVIDDAAVTPKFIHGFSADRELPIVWKIARGSLFNKIIILLPAALLLSVFAPWAIPPLLMVGGTYLCFEGAEKVWHALHPADHNGEKLYEKKQANPQLEEQKVKGAVKTDFILSAEIMTIVLSALPDDLSLPMVAGALFVAAVIITLLVYGAVALIVKADDVGLHMATEGRLSATRRLGAWIVQSMPKLLMLLVIIGTAAMIWVGGSIIVHGAYELGLIAPYETIHHFAERVGHMVPQGVQQIIEWTIVAFLDGLIGLGLGLIVLFIVTRIIAPLRGSHAKAPAETD